MDRYTASRIVRRLATKAGIDHKIGCHLPRLSSTTNGPAATRTGTPTRSSPPSPPAAPDRQHKNRH
jgi:hypothetical protein